MKYDTPADPVLSTGQAADYLGVTTRTIVRWCDDQVIDYLLLPSGHRRIKMSALQALEVKVEGRRVPG